jgi:hypothetical protein
VGRVKVALLVVLMASVEVAHAKSVAEVPDAKEWSVSFDKRSFLSMKAPVRVLVLESPTKRSGGNIGPKGLEFNQSLCEEASYVSCVNSANFDYVFKINKMQNKVSQDDLMKFSGSNVLIANQSAGIGLFVSGNKEITEFSKTGVLGKNANARKILSRMLATFGYDGVILDIREPYILVGTLDEKLRKKGLGGILVADSADKWFLTGGATTKSEAEALLILENSYAGYAVFKGVFKGDKNTAKIGQKIILEKVAAN